MTFYDLAFEKRFRIINTLFPNPDTYEKIRPPENELPLNTAINIKTGAVIIVQGDAEVCVVE